MWKVFGQGHQGLMHDGHSRLERERACVSTFPSLSGTFPAARRGCVPWVVSPWPAGLGLDRQSRTRAGAGAAPLVRVGYATARLISSSAPKASHASGPLFFPLFDESQPDLFLFHSGPFLSPTLFLSLSFFPFPSPISSVLHEIQIAFQACLAFCPWDISGMGCQSFKGRWY